MSSADKALSAGVDSLAAFRSSKALVTTDTLRIVHLSDLHFVTHFLLKRFTTKGLMGHSRDAIEALETTLIELHPDLLFITGDQTTWGDSTSLRSAYDYIKKLQASLNLGPDRVYWIPGNHDILLHYYFGNRFRKRKYDSIFGEVKPVQIAKICGYEVAVFSFDSTLDRKGSRSLLWPIVGSRGRVSPRSFNDFNKAMQDVKATQDIFAVAQVHHHPLPIPYKAQSGVTLELTTMTNGATFLAHMQESGVPLVLHGHEHIPFSHDYHSNPTKRATVVIAAGTSCQLGNERISFNYLQAVPHDRVIVRQYDYRETGFRINRECTKIFFF